MAETETQEAESRPQIPGIPVPELDLSWMKVPTERPPKPVVGEDGFTLKMADAGMYGAVDENEMRSTCTLRVVLKRDGTNM